MNNMMINRLHDLWCNNTEIERNNLKRKDFDVAKNLLNKKDVRKICLDNESYGTDYYGSPIFSNKAQGKISDLIKKDNLKVSDSFVKTFAEYCYQTKCCFEKYQKEYSTNISFDKKYNNACHSVIFNANRTLPKKKEPIQVTLKSILSCKDFMVSGFTNMSDYSISIKGLLSICKDMEYKEIKQDVEESKLTREDKKTFFAELLPTYNFEICFKFDSTWSMFKDNYIDFDTLVTKFWNKDNFEQKQNAPDQKNVFQNFAIEYNKYLNHEQLSDKNSIKDCAKNMINELEKRNIISKAHTQNLKNRIDDAIDVGILGIIAQFFANLFSKGRTAFQAVSKTRQDRVMNNFKPLLSLFKQANDKKI